MPILIIHWRRHACWRALLVGLVGLGMAFGFGCSHKDANGGGPEVLEKKFPGSPAQGSAGAKDPKQNAGQ